MNIGALPWKDITTFGLASVGAALGVLNTWYSLSQRRVTLVVQPTFATAFDGGGPVMLSIAVTNLSSFPLTINEVGYTGRQGAKRGSRAAILQPQIIDSKPWPRRLESREAVSVYFGVDQVHRHPGLLAKAYAKTDCGVYAYGTSSALKQLREIAHENR